MMAKIKFQMAKARPAAPETSKPASAVTTAPVPTDTTRQALEIGAQRLMDVQKQGRVQV